MVKKLWYKIPIGLRDAMTYLYCASAFIVLPWFLGAMLRQEQYFWIGDEWAYHPSRNIGIGNKLLGIYMYLVFYLSWFLIGYLLYDWGKNSMRDKIKSLESDVRTLSDELAQKKEKSRYTGYKKYQTVTEWWEREGHGKFPIQAPAAISKLQKEKGVSFHEAFEYLVEQKILIPTGYVES